MCCPGNAEQTTCVVKAGAVPRFVALLKSPEENVCEQAVWALGNIAGDGPHLRDQVIEAGGVEHLVQLVTSQAKVPAYSNSRLLLGNYLITTFVNLGYTIGRASSPHCPVLMLLVPFHVFEGHRFNLKNGLIFFCCCILYLIRRLFNYFHLASWTHSHNTGDIGLSDFYFVC